MPAVPHPEIERVFREQYGRAVAVLVRVFGDIDLAEEAVQDAFTAAVASWPDSGLPPAPAGWIITTARNRAIDRLRRESSRDDRHAQAMLLQGSRRTAGGEPGAGRRLRLIFTCCHPALDTSRSGGADAAAARRTEHARDRTGVLGLRVDDGPATGTREGKDPRRAHPVPGPQGGRPAGAPRSVLAVIYLIFNEGYTASSGDRLIREELSDGGDPPRPAAGRADAGRAGSVGLLALMLLEQARSEARTTPDGKLVPLPEQDRSLWDRNLIQEGQELVRRCLRRNQPGPYQIQAAINAVHSDAPTAAQTDWNQILALYDQLLAITPTPIVALNRAVAVAEIDGPQVALELIDELPLEHYYLFHAIRADLLRRLGHARPSRSRLPRSDRAHRQRRRDRIHERANLSNQSCQVMRTHLLARVLRPPR